MDVFSVEKRSQIMSKIRSRGTKIEMKMKDLLSANGYEFIEQPKIIGSPDFLITKKRMIIFCDGDFWHGYKFDEKKKPSGTYWKTKIQNNMRRDKRISRNLRSDGWTVIRLWEHDINKRPEYCMNKISRSFERSDHL